MEDVLERIKTGFQEIFPELGDTPITADTQLGDIPDWDSMAAVNLQSFVDQQFQVSIPDDLLGEETTVGELIAFIQNPA
jgi:acyl carrier protein